MQIEDTEDDQAVFTDLFLSHPDRIVIDYDQVMFGNARWTKKLDEGGCPFKPTSFNDGLYHEETYNVPLVLHTPGKYWECYDVLVNALGLEPVVHTETLTERTKHRDLQYGPEYNFFAAVVQIVLLVLKFLGLGGLVRPT
jgi:hypothetical protein